MKKLYTLFFAAAVSFTANAQVTNGNLEAWTDNNTPEAFSPAPFTAGVSKEATIKHGGEFSAKHQTPTLPTSGTSVKIQNETAVIVPGVSYTISYWYLDNDPAAKSRPWIYWLNETNATITANEAEFRPSTYSTDSPDWQLWTTTVVAPAGAAKLRFEMRSYADGSAGGGVIYYDDMSVTSPMKVSQNSINGLNIYPNPVTTGTFYINTSSNDQKSVSIFDVLGKQVLKTKTSNAVNVSALTSGVYILKITENGSTATRKLVIK